jgi:hypothetical protein
MTLASWHTDLAADSTHGHRSCNRHLGLGGPYRRME